MSNSGGFESSGSASFIPSQNPFMDKAQEQSLVVGTKQTNKQFQDAHRVSDTDAEWGSMHHTLGLGHNQGVPASLLNNIAPIGQRIDFAGPITALPQGFLPEDGRSVLVVDYPALFRVIGYEYGGAGANFNIPDSRRRSTIGTDTDAQLGDNDGAVLASRDNVASISVSIPSHTHGTPNPTGTLSSAPDHVHGVGSYSTGPPSSAIGRADGAGTAAHPSHTHSMGGASDPNGSHSHTFTGGGAGSTGSGGGATGSGSDTIPYLKSTKAIRFSWGL